MQQDISKGREGRDQGIEKAVSHAEQVSPGWNDIAYGKLLKFLKEVSGEFMAEDFRAYAAMDDTFPLPPHSRAFGGIMRRAAIAGVIEKVRYQQVANPKAHCCYATVWRRAAA